MAVARVGQGLPRHEDVPLLQGEGTFVASVVEPDAAHVQYVTSPIAHAVMTSIDVTDATAAPGVLAVVTGADLDAAGLPRTAPGYMAEYPDAAARPILARDHVRFVGEAIVAIVAETAAQAADAAELVVIDYDPLPVVTDMATAHEAPAIFDEVGTNVAVTESLPDADPIDFSGYDVVVTATITNNRVAPVPIEGRVASARWVDGRLHQHAACQGVHPVRAAIARWYGLDNEQVRVTTTDVGGSFGSKARSYPEDLILGHLSRLIDRPVVWNPSRSVDMVGLGHSRGQTQTFTIGGDRDGRIRAIQTHVRQDLGAYPTGGLALARNANRMLPGPYDVDHVYWTLDAVVTNTTPLVAYRGAGRPESGSMMNRAVDLFAAECGMDPIEVRRINLMPSDRLPWMNPTGVHYDTGDYPGGFEQMLETLEVDAVRAEQQQRLDRNDPVLVGVGTAVFVDRTAGIASPAYGSLELTASGDFIALTGSSPYGQGHYTTWKQIISERTGMPVERITIRHGDTDVVPRGGITGGSKSVQMWGSAMAVVSEEMVERSTAVAAGMLEAAASDVVIDTETGLFHVAGAPGAASVSWIDIAAEIARQANSDDGDIVWACEADFEIENHSVPYGAYGAIVEVDRETGDVRLRRMVTLDDAGTIVNPLLFYGQVHGGVAQGIGQVLFEEYAFDPDGNPLHGDLLSYCVPSAAELPSFECFATEHPTPRNPLGAKGIGESGALGAVPAVHGAVLDALAPLGIRHIDMPLTPLRVWRAISASS